MKNRSFKIFGFSVLVLILAGIFFYNQSAPATEFVWGLNFSQSRARELGLNVGAVYLDMLADLRPAKIRLNAYWNQIEPERGRYDFSEIDYLLKIAQDYQTEVILTLGKKQPRWPECHEPDWVRNLTATEQQDVQIEMIRNAVEHFKAQSSVKIWQLENEPLFRFGDDCPKLSRSFVKQEIALIKSLDTRPVIVTDSGETGRWLPTATLGADLFGTTMYRVVRNDLIGYFRYPLPPAFFRIKAGILKTLIKNTQIVGVELQAEPWLVDPVSQTDLKIQLAFMNPKIFQEYIAYAKEAGFSENYLWGVEWWYWLAKTKGDWGMWASAKELLSK